MKKSVITLLSAAAITLVFAFSPQGKLVTNKTHVKFFSSTEAEDIEAHNYKSVSTIDTESGAIVFSVPMQSFEFEKRMMQRHFNQKKFLNTKEYPKGKLVGQIDNINEIDFTKKGTYSAKFSGDMTIHGVTKKFKAEGEFKVKDGNISLNSKFPITLADYGIAFEKGKPSTNIAETVEVTVEAEYIKS